MHSLSGDRVSRHESGQSIVELALIVPVAILLLLGILDFARWYTTAVTIESGAREAADFGAFSNGNWAAANVASTEEQMRYRACIAASTLPEYVPDADPAVTCSNPAFQYELVVPPGIADCSDAANDPPCVVHVTLTYSFKLLSGVLPIPSTIVFTRESRFAVSSLGTP